MSPVRGLLWVPAVMAVLCGTVGCQTLFDAFGVTLPSVAPMPALPLGVRLHIENQSELPVLVEAVFFSDGKVVRESLHLLDATGPESTQESISTRADRITTRAIAAGASPEAAPPDEAAARVAAGDVLSEQVFLVGEDFELGGMCYFTIPLPGPETLTFDCNSNGIADATDIEESASEDCNTNGVPDECDIAEGTSGDCDGNAVPDECDIDRCVEDLFCADCNENGVPDGCDLADGTSGDCNTNGVPDECDIASGLSADLNASGIPDECEPQQPLLFLDSPLVGLGREIGGTVELLHPASGDGIYVELTSENPKIAQITSEFAFFEVGQRVIPITVSGISLGTVLLTATAPPLEPATASITVTDALISLPPMLEVAPDQTASLPVSLTKPAPTGGVTIALEIDDPSVATVTPSVFIAEGLQIPAANPQVAGVRIGTARITATAIGFAPDNCDVEVTVHLTFEPTSANVVAGNCVDLRLRLSSPVEGLVIDLSTDDPQIATVQETIIASSCESCLVVTVCGVLADNSTTLRASAPGVEEATATINVDTTPEIYISDVAVGDDLQREPSSHYLTAAAPAGGVDVTLTSLDPARVLLSADPVAAGSGTLVVHVEAGQTWIPSTYVQGLDDTGTVIVDASAPGYLPTTFDVTLYPSGFLIYSPGNFPTTTLSDPRSINIRSARLWPDPPNVAEYQQIRGGLPPVNVDVTSSNPAVGVITDRPVVFYPDDGLVTTHFDPLDTGTTNIGVVNPDPGEWQTPSSGQQITATVNEPGMYISNVAVGKNLQTEPDDYYLYEPAPAGGVDVTLKIESPSGNVWLSDDWSSEGSENDMVLHVDEGQTWMPAFYIQALDDTGTVDITASAPGYQGTTFAVTLYPSGFYIDWPGDFSTTPYSGNEDIDIAVTTLSAGPPYWIQYDGWPYQTIRAGFSPVDVEVTSSVPEVGDILISPVTFGPGDAFGYTEFEPFDFGQSDITISTPAGFETPETDQSITATVTEPYINFSGSAQVGKDLQTTLYYSYRHLSDPAPGPDGVDVTLTSQDPSRVLLSEDPTALGSDSIVVNVPAGSTQIPEFYIQGLDDGIADPTSVDVVATADGYLDDTLTVTLQPSGFYIYSPSGISTTTFSGNTTIQIQPTRLDPATLDIQTDWRLPQYLRGGMSPVSVNVASSDTNVGTITDSPVVFDPSVGTVYTYFDPNAAGSTEISIDTPAGFETPSSNQQITATVGAPNAYFYYGSVTVGLDLQFALSVHLAVAPPSPVDVRVTSCTADIASISADSNLEGGTSVLFTGVTGTYAGTIYVQGRSLSCTTLKVQAAGYNDGTCQVTVDPSGFYIDWPSSDFTTQTSATDTAVSIRPARLDLTTLNTRTNQNVRGGLTVNVEVSSSNEAVGFITDSPLVFGPNVGYQATYFSPQVLGTTVISVGTPPGFYTPSNRQQVTATVYSPSPLYVDDTSDAEEGDGASWETAFRFLADALALASNPLSGVEQIIVGQGEYRPDRSEASPDGTGDHAATFHLVSGVQIYGGYAGFGAPDPDARDVAAYQTTLSGDLFGDDGSPKGGAGDNSYHVVTGSGTDPSAVLDGCNVTAGNAVGSSPDNQGGGMVISDGSPTLSDCTFAGSNANFGGGGLYISGAGSSPALTGCSFAGNVATTSSSSGAGVYNEDAAPFLTDCTFTDNRADFEGGGLYNRNGSPTLIDCTFEGNECLDFDSGGGMYSSTSGIATLTGCTFTGNTAPNGTGGGLANFGPATLFDCSFDGNSAISAGGMYNTHSDVTLTDCSFNGNTADFRGAGMYNASNSSPTLTRCSFIGNTAAPQGTPFRGSAEWGSGKSGTARAARRFQPASPAIAARPPTPGFAGEVSNGGGMYNWISDPVLIDCTFVRNEASSSGGGMYNYESSPTVTDCVFNQNSATSGGGVYNEWNSIPAFYNSVFCGNSAAPGGGGVYNDNSDPTLTNCAFSGNSVTFRGGGIFNFQASPTLVNCSFGGNAAGSSGGGIYDDSGNSTVTNCVLWGNTDLDGADESAQIHIAARAVTVNYSCIQGFVTLGGIGNTGADPLFVGGPSGSWTADAVYDSSIGKTTVTDDSAAFGVGELVDKFLNPNTGQSLQGLIVGNTETTILVLGDFAAFGTSGTTYQVMDYHLAFGSSCIDAADNTAVPPDAADLDGDSDTTERVPVDLDGNARFLDDAGIPDTGVNDPPNYPAFVDMGAYEFTGTTPPGACCLPDGSCQDGMDQPACEAISGVFEGYGTDCATTICPQPGACCAPDGSCTLSAVVGGADCADVYQGDDTTCTPNPCPILPGACCHPDGFCSDEADEATCDKLGGLFEGYGTDCATTICPLPGACCVPDGTCTMSTVVGGADCADVYQGDDTTCTPNPCPILPGACCYYPDGSCTDEPDEATCTGLGGLFEGHGTDCTTTTCPVPPPVLFVDGDLPAGTGDGESWGTAFSELQDALLLADNAGGNVTEIWAAATTQPYRPDEGVGQTPGDRTATFQLIDGVAISGGFDGTEATFAERAGLFDQTILDGDLNGDDYTGGDNSENSYHVATGSGTNSTAVLDGFTITAGHADGASPNDVGGGMFNDLGSPTVANCVFDRNEADLTFPTFGLGGGMYNSGSSPTLTNCAFVQNWAVGGGGMFNTGSSNPLLEYCIFTRNSAGGGGGMTNTASSSPTLVNCTFVGNRALPAFEGFGFSGGGMANSLGSSPTLTNCLFAGNSAFDEGGAVTVSGDSSPILTNCTLAGNLASNGGGVYYGSDLGIPTLVNSILWGNAPDQINGLVAVTFSDVQGGWNGTGNIAVFPDFALDFWGMWTVDGIFDPSTGETTFTDGQANFVTDELVGRFVSPNDWQYLQALIVANTATTITVLGDFAAMGGASEYYQLLDYHILSGSPCIDSGDTTALIAAADPSDLDGDGNVAEPTPRDLDLNERIVDDLSAPDSGINISGQWEQPPIVDMGPYEVQPMP